MLRLTALALTVLSILTFAAGPAFAAKATRAHGIAMHGNLKYPAEFRNFDYVNPAAPKGGNVRLSALGGYDSFNGFIIKGRSAIRLGLIYDSLMVSSADEPFSKYCLLCESIEVPEDRSWVTFTLREKARWHDGKPVTADDLIWTFNTLLEKGTPGFRFYYAGVKSVKKAGPRTVKFTFVRGENRELPLILGELPVLPKHYWESRDFGKSTLDPPLGSGPYKIESFEPGRSITYARVPDYWGASLPVNVGANNFDRVRYDYYRDATVAVEAFKAGATDYRDENSSRHWATSYNIPARRDGRMTKEVLKHGRSAGMQGFVFNMRRPFFKDRLVRRALAYAFDFEWSNKTLFYGQYTRTRSFFQNSELAATGVPRGRELEILKKYRDRLPPELFATEYRPPKTDGSGNNRANLKAALELLKRAGWDIDPDQRKLVDKETGEAMRFEVLLISPLFERVVLPMKKNLARLGIDITVRTVDSSQYTERVRKFDFDMIVTTWGQSLSPGNEQRSYWTTESAGQIGSRNYSGLKDPVVDALVELLIAAPTRRELVFRTRALDRVLQWKHIVIPQLHIAVDRVIYWNKFGRPSVIPLYGSDFFTWWVDPAKERALKKTGDTTPE